MVYPLQSTNHLFHHIQVHRLYLLINHVASLVDYKHILIDVKNRLKDYFRVNI